VVHMPRVIAHLSPNCYKPNDTSEYNISRTPNLSHNYISNCTTLGMTTLPISGLSIQTAPKHTYITQVYHGSRNETKTIFAINVSNVTEFKSFFRSCDERFTEKHYENIPQLNCDV